MATKIYLSNEPSEIAGYLKAYIGGPSPRASSTVSTTVTNTEASGTDIQQTLTAGGTVAKWITQPLKNAVTVSTALFVNVWAKESAAAANAEVYMKVNQYTTSLQAAFLATAKGAELTTSSARTPWLSTESVTSTAFAAGDRLAVTPYITNEGTMGASETVTMSYNGNTVGADGDTYLFFNEDLQAGESQFGDGSTSAIPGGPALQAYETLRTNITPLVGQIVSGGQTVTDLLNELTYQRDIQGA